MFCHECVMHGCESPAVAICEFCRVGLCKPHLVELYETLPASLRPSCRHDRRGWPARVIGRSADGERTLAAHR